MSLLRNVLKKNTATTDDVPTLLSEKSRQGLRIIAAKNVKKAADTKSVGGVSVYSVRSIAASMASFTSTLFGQRVPKRRRPDVSTLGLPKWYNKDPPEPIEVPGTEIVDLTGQPYTAAHATSMRQQGADEMSPYLTVVLYSHATPEAQRARYFNDATIKGQLRLRLPKREAIASIDIWCICTSESNFNALDCSVLNYHANLWSRETNKIATVRKGQFPENQTFVFPFEMPKFPKDTQVHKPSSSDVTRLILPPTFRYTVTGLFSSDIKYYIGVNIQWAGIGAIHDEWNVPFQYTPLRRPIPRAPTLFPFISDREDWPLKREEVGGWTLTPFGGRGRFRDEIVEIEGLLGVQAPEVYCAGQTLRYSILLWSKSIPALGAISETKTDNIDVVFVQSATFGMDVLQPRNSARKNRALKRLAQGRIWRTDDGPPPDDSVPTLKDWPVATRPTQPGPEQKIPSESSEKIVGITPALPISPAKRSRFQSVVTAEEDEDEDNGEEENESAEKRSTSPPLSEDGEDEVNGFSDLPPQEGTIRLDGDVRIPNGLQPSFRHKWIGREYALMVTFTHPDYQHISPAAASIYAETPIWVVLGNPEAAYPAADATVQDEAVLRELPVVGEAIPVDESTIFSTPVIGRSTTKARPLLAGERGPGF